MLTNTYTYVRAHIYTSMHTHTPHINMCTRKTHTVHRNTHKDTNFKTNMHIHA